MKQKLAAETEEEAASAAGASPASPARPQRLTKSLFGRLVEAAKRKELSSLGQLLDQEPRLLFSRDKQHRNLLHYAVILVQDEPNKREATEASGKEAAAAAADERARNSLACFNLLLDKGRQLDANQLAKLWPQADLDGLTILHLAVISCNTLLVREILAKAPGPRAAGAQVGVAAAARPGGLDSLAQLLDKERHSPLHWAVITNSLANVRLLIEDSGVQLAQQRDSNGATPLHYATQTSDYLKYRQQLRQMLKNAAEAEAEGKAERKQSPERPATKRRAGAASELARRESSVEVAGLELQAGEPSANLDVLLYLARLEGADLECRDRDARTPLLWAASSGNRQALQALVQAGADPLSRDSNQLGALHCAASHGFIDCLECLLSLLAANNKAPLSADKQRQEPTAGAPIDQTDSLNCTPLFYAVLSANIDCVELLLERGAQPNWQDIKGRTAAHFAALKGQLNTLKLLEARGANLWLANKQGDLPLHYAIKSGRRQVVAWLLERSPYERAVNAINNSGRAPIHLAVMRANSALVEFLIGRGANLNQLVKVRDKQASAAQSLERTDSSAGRRQQAIARRQTQTEAYRYETALDMAQRLASSASSTAAANRRCLELLQAQAAKSAAQVLASRAQGQRGSLFEQQAAGAPTVSPIGFETSGSSAEPQSELPLWSPADGGVPPLPARPQALCQAQLAHDDSTASSAMSQSSLTSLRGAPARDGGGRREEAAGAAEGAERANGGGGSPPAISGPIRGGLTYRNDHMRASIKCKLHDTSGASGACNRPAAAAGRQEAGSGAAFPPLAEWAGPQRQRSVTTRTTTSAASQQEIVTHVNVFTSPVDWGHQQPGARRALEQRVSATRGRAARRREPECYSETTSSANTTADSDAASETNFEESEPEGDGGEGDEGAGRAGVRLAGSEDELQQQRHEFVRLRQPGQQRFVPSSQGYTQHLPVIMSAAEEERSTSGDTIGEQGGAEAADGAGRKQAARSPARSPARRPLAERYRDQVSSPVAEYIQQRAPIDRERPRNWQQQHQQMQRADYSQVKAKVDSHRNDSGLSSHFGDDNSSELGQHSAAGRRSKSWSTSSSGLPTVISAAHPAPPLSPAGARDYTGQRRSNEPAGGARSPARLAGGERPSRTIIKTRRLSVDSVELASSVEKSIRKYKQESKLFLELQNLKKSQIRSGRANEALLVKRLIEQFKSEAQRTDTLIGLETYNGPYTYKAYELYLYDQLRKLSQSNEAKLVGSRAPHKFTGSPAAAPEMGARHSGELDDSGRETRDYLAEDLNAELELQRVINRTGHDAIQSYLGARADELAIEPTGALEEIRVRRQTDESRQRAAAADEEFGAGSPVRRIEIQRESIHRLAEVEERPSSAESADGAEAMQRPPPSSASSSRRSSLEVERERLEKLPLRVADSSRFESSKEDSLQRDTNLDEAECEGSAVADSRRLIESEAAELTAAIVTDALGNVSRTGSRTGSPLDEEHQTARKLELEVGPETSETNENKEDQRQAAGRESEGEAAEVESNETLAEGDEMDEEAEAQRARVARRRSVVNIGDKVEVIYHDVGIAIEPVAEGNRSEEEDEGVDHSEPGPQQEALEEAPPAGVAREAEEGTISTAAGGDEELVREAAMEAKRDSEDSEDSEGAEASERVGADSEAAGELESVQGQVGERREPLDKKRGQVYPSAEAMEARPAGLKSVGEPKAPRIPSANRRASSPPSAFELERSARSQAASSAAGRASIGYVPSATRRVFTGFDLDDFHSHRCSSRSQRASSIRGRSLTSQTGEELDKAGVRLQTKEAGVKRPQRRRLERSRPPPGPYRVEIPLDLIKQRWLRVKRIERRRLRESTNWEAAAAAEAESRRRSRPSLGHAKSQPNLEDKKAASRSLGQEDDEVVAANLEAPAKQADECWNFTLIYELNKRLRTGADGAPQTSGTGEGRQIVHKGLWCQRKVARIVDARTLKRTLSLPESLLYSNDLLKRFNILKL